jgi:signal transduction histidine kinase
MASGVLTSLQLAFFAAGLTLWLTSLALSRRSRRYQSGMQTLLQLGGSSLEPLDIPAAAWPVLQDAGWQSLWWEGDWYGQPVQGSLGASADQPQRKAAPQTFTLSSGDEVQLHIQMLHSAPRGEQRIFAIQLAQVFVLLLETRLRERTGALSAALAERARLSLYLQHDMRNLAQWVGWVSTDFANAQTEPDLLAAAQRLRGNAPLAQERARRLNAALGKSGKTALPCEMGMREALNHAASMAGVEISVEGDAVAWIAPDVLSRALDNLLSNLAAGWREGRTQPPNAKLRDVPARDGQPDMAALTLHCPLPAQGMDLAPERLFEPFASGRPGGQGLGLYQARKSLRESGGDLKASVAHGCLRFELLIPQKRTNVTLETVPQPFV